MEDRFFNENMKLQFESEYPYIHDHYDLMITEDIVRQTDKRNSQIRDIVLKSTISLYKGKDYLL